MEISICYLKHDLYACSNIVHCPLTSFRAILDTDWIILVLGSDYITCEHAPCLFEDRYDCDVQSITMLTFKEGNYQVDTGPTMKNT